MREHVKKKRIALEEKAPSDGHVKPLNSRDARRIRRESRKERMAASAENAAMGTSPPAITPMKPRRPHWTAPRNSPERIAVKRTTNRVRPIGLVWMSWRWVSGALSAILIILLSFLLTSEAFYVSTIAVGGVTYLTREEVFRFSGISQQHIFWVDADAVESQLKANNNIADAEVRVGWPPNMVQIIVRERDPVLTWEQGSDRVWVDINGLVMYQRVDRPDLLRIVYDPSVPENQIPITPNTHMDTEIIHGALLLKSRLTSIDVLLYHPTKGLGWRDPRGWMAWFGIGDNMEMKARVYEALVVYNIDAVQFAEINIADPDNPVYTILWRKSGSN